MLWTGTTFLVPRSPCVAVLYSPLAACGVLFVSPWFGGVLCIASLLAICASPTRASSGAALLAAAVVAVSACALHAAYRQRTEREDFDRILSTVRRVSSSLEADEVLQAIVRTAREATGAKASSLRLLAPDRRTLVVRAADGLSKAYMDKGPVDVRRSSIDRKVLEGEIVEVRDAATDPRFQYPEQAREEGIAAVLCVPLRRDSTMVGVLRVYSGQPRRFGPRERRLLTALAAQAVIALRHAELHRTTLTFMRKVTHELRAPLAAISTNLKVLLELGNGGWTEKQEQMLRRADRRAMVLLEAVSDLLSLSRARLDKPQEDGAEVRLPELVASIVTLVRPQAEQAGLRLETDLAPGVPPLMGNPDEIEQLISNLIANAIKYTPSGGMVAASVQPAGAGVLLRVADTGIGIPKAELPRLFDEFHRCANARSSGIEGTGLGMAIVRAIADRHRAEVRVESEEGRGTVVEVAFPVAPA